MSILIITRSELKKLWNIKDSIPIVEEILKYIGEGKVEQQHCPVLCPAQEDFSFILPHPAWIKPWNVVGDKWLGVAAANPGKGLPYAIGTTVINDSETLQPIAFMDATYLTGMRTAAMAAIGAKYLARRNSSVLSVVGCGVQGQRHIEAMVEIELFDFKEIRIFDINPDTMNNLKTEMEKKLHLKLKPVGSVREAAEGADILCFVTTSRKPLLFDEWLKKGTHLVSSCLWDIDMKLILKTVDKWVLGNTAADRQYFENKEAKQKYNLSMSDVYGDLSEIVCGKKPGRERENERTTMTHLGMGANDVGVAYHAFKKAKKMGLGVEVDMFS